MMSLSPGSVMLKVHTLKYFPALSSWHGADDVTVPWVSDAQGAHSEVLPAGRAQLVVVASVVVDSCLGQHGVVLNLRLSEWWSIVSDDDKLRLPISQGLQCLLVSQAVLPRLHHQRQAGVDGFIGLLQLLSSHHVKSL